MRIELKAKASVVFSWLEAISTRRCMIVSEGEEIRLDLYRPVVDNLSSAAGKATPLSQKFRLKKQIKPNIWCLLCMHAGCR